MKAKDLAEILLQHPEVDVVFLGPTGPRDIDKVIKCNLATDKMYSFESKDCLLLDDNCNVRRTWLNTVKGEILNGNFIFEDENK